MGRKLLTNQTGALALSDATDQAWAGGHLSLHAVGTFASLEVHCSPVKNVDSPTDVTDFAPVHTFTTEGVASYYLGPCVIRATADATAVNVTLTLL